MYRYSCPVGNTKVEISDKTNIMEEKTERNREIYNEWRAGLKEYSDTGDSSKKISFATLGKKYKLSKNYVMTICNRELRKDEQTN